MSEDNQMQALLEERIGLITESRSVCEVAIKENRDLSGEEQQAEEKRDERITSIEGKLDLYRKNKDREAKSKKYQESQDDLADQLRGSGDQRHGSDFKFTAEDYAEAFVRCSNGADLPDRLSPIAHKAMAKHVDTDRAAGMYGPEQQRQLWTPAEYRAVQNLVVGTDIAGGHTVPTGFVRRLEEALYWHGDVRAVSELMLTSSGNPLEWPSVNDVDGSGDPNEGEEGAVSQAEPEMAFDQIILSAYKYSSKEVKVSRELFEDSAFDIPSLVGDLLGKRLARTQNKLLTTGTGSSQPQGVVTGSSLGVTAASNAAITPDELMDLIWAVDRSYRSAGKFMMHDNTAKYVRQLKDGDGNYFLVMSNNVGELDRLFGYELRVNNDMAEIATVAKTVLFGDFKKFKVREVRRIRTVRLNELYAKNDLLGFFSWIRFDSHVLDAGNKPIQYLQQAV